jgi:hypothetical protein
MPMGMQAVEFIPNTMQEEWTDAWNVAHEIIKTGKTDIDKERGFKWNMWMPQGLLPMPTRGGKNVTRQFKEIARRFLISREPYRGHGRRWIARAWRT